MLPANLKYRHDMKLPKLSISQTITSLTWRSLRMVASFKITDYGQHKYLAVSKKPDTLPGKFRESLVEAFRASNFLETARYLKIFCPHAKL